MFTIKFYFLLLTSLVLLLQIQNGEANDVKLMYEKYPLGSKLPQIPFQEGSYFFEHVYTLNWYQAVEVCRSHGMHLVSVESQEENDFLVSQFAAPENPQRYWTSGSDRGVNGTHVWLSTGFPLSYTNWDTRQPSHTNSAGDDESCIEYWDGYWNDLLCLRDHHVICEVMCDQFCTLS